MKTILVLLVIGVAAYFFYARDTRTSGPVIIENPVYAEIRIDMPVSSRNFELVLFGKMASQEDCEKRTEQVWGKVIDDCPNCTSKIAACRTTLEPRYLRLFDNQPINTTYISFTRGDPGERDGRMVFWGVTAEESNLVCEKAKTTFAKRYKGTVVCVAAKDQ